MFCSECGSSNAENAKFCYQCGQGIRLPYSTHQKTVLPKAATQKPKNSVSQSLFPILAAVTIVLVIVVGVIGANIFLEYQRQQSAAFRSPANAANSISQFAPAPTPN